MKQITNFSIGCLLVLLSCTPRISTSISKNYSELDYREEVRVLGLQDAVPSNSEELGEVKIGDSGFSVNCGWDVVIDKAKIEARKIGGNAIKIIKHIPPSPLGSSCDRITAKILKVKDFANMSPLLVKDSALINADYALLHVYRPGGAGALVSYDLYLGDSIICRVSNKWKKTLKIRKDGLNNLWARTEVKKEIPINVKFGNEYYVRCSLTMGAFVGHPKLELVDPLAGKTEFQALKVSKANRIDVISLTDGRDLECRITGEDNEYVYFNLLKDNREIKTQLSKNQIKSIQRSE